MTTDRNALTINNGVGKEKEVRSYEKDTIFRISVVAIFEFYCPGTGRKSK
jgi:hypothetical protein